MIGGATFSIAHYLTYNDAPSARLEVRALSPQPDAPFLVEFYQQQITGGSATFALPFDPYTIVRSEIAHFWDERVFIPQQSANAAELTQRFIAGQGVPVVGALPTRNVLRWMVGVDRNVWLRWLNPSNTFFLSADRGERSIGLDWRFACPRPDQCRDGDRKCRRDLDGRRLLGQGGQRDAQAFEHRAPPRRADPVIEPGKRPFAR